MKIAIVGSRTYPDESQVRAFVDALPHGTVIVSGGAAGVDLWAESQAQRDGLATIIHRPQPVRHGHQFATLERNKRIVAELVGPADYLVAFHAGNSPGTAHAIGLARAAGIKVVVYTPDRKVTP